MVSSARGINNAVLVAKGRRKHHPAASRTTTTTTTLAAAAAAAASVAMAPPNENNSDPDPDPESPPCTLHPLLPAPIPLTELQDTPADIAIGVELKFLVPFLVSSPSSPSQQDRVAAVADPCPRDSRPIAFTPHADSPDRLQEQAYRAVVDIIRTGAKQPAISVAEIARRGLRESDFWCEHWIVKRSNSAEPGPREKELRGCVWAPLEVSSPKLRALDPRTARVLRDVTRALDRGCRATVNYSCEVHVHLGRADGRALSLPALKRLASVCWLAEPTLRLLKDPASPNFDHTYTWSSPLRERSRLAGLLAPPRGEDFAVSPRGTAAENSLALARVWEAPDYVALGRLLSGDTKPFRRLGFNFSAFGLEDERAGRSPRSVEVRFLEDCWGEEDVVAWARVCTALAVVAVEGPRGRFRELLHGMAGYADEGPGSGERMARLLGLLGLESGVVELFREKVERIARVYPGSLPRY